MPLKAAVGAGITAAALLSPDGTLSPFENNGGGGDTATLALEATIVSGFALGALLCFAYGLRLLRATQVQHWLS